MRDALAAPAPCTPRSRDFSRLTTLRAVPAARGGGTGRAGPSGALGRLFRRTLARGLLGRPFHRAPGPPVGQ